MQRVIAITRSRTNGGIVCNTCEIVYAAPVDKNARIEDLIRNHSGREGPLLPILHDVQAEFGCVDEDAIRAIALGLNLTRAEVHGVVSFYHDFKSAPDPRPVIKLCKAEACQARGVDALEVPDQERVRIELVYCLGLCSVGPAAMTADGRVHARLESVSGTLSRSSHAAAPVVSKSVPEPRPNVRVSDDAVALACGADAVAAAFVAVGCEVERVSSWGMHWLEPLVEIDGVGYGPVSVEDVAAFVSPAQAGGSAPLGTGQGVDSRKGPRLRGGDTWGFVIDEHPFILKQQRLTFARAGKTRPLSLDDYAATGGWAGLAKAREAGAEATIETVLGSGLRGRGGAGFPAGIKWKTVADAVGPRKYIVCNADEGDSGTFADRMVMEGDPFMLIEGMAIAGFAVGAGKGFVYIRSEYPHAIAKMEAAIRASAHLVAPFEIEVRVGGGAYVCGEETSLLNSIEGKRGEVRAKPPLPAHEGLFSCPTVINNVLTLAAVPWIMANGAQAYAAFGMGRSKGTMPIQLAGNIKHGGLFEVAFGMTLRELVYDIGGGTASGYAVKAVQVGGPLGAFIHPGQFDLPFDYEAYAAADALIGHAGIVVFDESADMARQARFAMEFCAIESCGKCTPCRIGSTRGVEVLDRVIAGRGAGRGVVPAKAGTSAAVGDAVGAGDSSSTGPRLRGGDDLALITDLCETMKYGSLCALGGFTPYPVMSAIKHWPEDFA